MLATSGAPQSQRPIQSLARRFWNKSPCAAPAPDPLHRWDRPLQAPGHMQVDFEERVDFKRLNAYRLGRTRQALAKSGLGALLVFDQYNLRYISSSVIGEWARDKLTRW